MISSRNIVTGFSIALLAVSGLSTPDVSQRQSLLRGQIDDRDLLLVDGGGDGTAKITGGRTISTASPSYAPSFQASASYHGYLSAQAAVHSARLSLSDDL